MSQGVYRHRFRRPPVRRWVPPTDLGGINATLSQTLGALTGVETATVAIAATLSKTLGILTGAETATVDIRAVLAQTLGALTLSGQISFSDINAVLSQTLGALTAVATATVAIAAQSAPTLGALTLVATATSGGAPATDVQTQILACLDKLVTLTTMMVTKDN